MNTKTKRLCRYRNYVAILLCMTILFTIGLSIPTYAKTPDCTVRLGCFPLQGFYDFAEDGSISGYGVEYMDAVASHAGWSIKYVPYKSWVDALDALSRNEIDLLAPAQHTTQRDEQYTFDSFPIGNEYGALFTLDSNNSLIYEDYTNFNNLKVGCVESVVFLDDFKDYEVRNNFSVNLAFYRDTPSLIEALNAGEVDAIVANLMVRTDDMKLLARFAAKPFYYMLSSKADNLRDDLNLAIDKISSQHPEFQNQLRDDYYPQYNDIPFSKSELDFIAQCEPINVACEANYAPFSYVDDKTGKIAGVDYHIFEQIAKITGLKFSYHALAYNNNESDYIKNNNIMVVAGVENNENTNKLHDNNFTDSYLTISKYFVGKTSIDFDSTKPMIVAALIANDEQITSWKEIYPEFEFNRYSSATDCLKAIRNGEADLILGDRYSLERILAAPRNQDLQMFLSKAVTSRICAKILSTEDEKQEEMLASILNKAINQISESDKEMYISDCAHATSYQYGITDFLYQYRLPIFHTSAILILSLIAIIAAIIYRRKTMRVLAESEFKLRHITNNINGGVVVLKANQSLQITFANDGFLEMLGYSRQQFENQTDNSYLTYVHPDDLSVIKTAMESKEKELSLDLRIRNKDGGYLATLFSGTVGEKINGEEELYCVILDMTEQNKLLEKLQIENRRIELILDRVDEVFYEVNLRDKTIITSNSFSEKLGWDLPDKIPKWESDIIARTWNIAPDDLKKLESNTKELLSSKQPVSSTVRIECKPKNTYVWCEICQYPILSEGEEVVSIIGMLRNVDEQVKERNRLLEQAQRDALTGLYNKEAFENLVKEALLQKPGENHALIFIDLDYFKSLNDTLGHMMGDRAICEAADKLKVIFSNYDLISRFGGDEFCIFVKNIPHETLRGKINWLIDKIHAEYHGEKGNVSITGSCGIACTDIVGYDYQSLMQCADKALYYSKEQGRDRFTFYRDIIQLDNVKETMD